MKLVDLRTSLDLKDRTLWFDGESSMSPERIADLILSGRSISGIHPNEIDASVKKYNLYTEDKLTLKEDANLVQPSFNLPEKYRNLDLKKFFFQRLNSEVELGEFSAEDIEKRISRVKTELKLFDQYEIVGLIQSTIYIIDTFEEHNVVWGTGRGSSCACYCLYLAGLHEVDSVLYDLDLNEFFR